MRIKGTRLIVTHSMSAIINLWSGYVGLPAKIRLTDPESVVILLWVPGHEGNPGNEAVHLAVCAPTNQAEGQSSLRNQEEKYLSYVDRLN